MQHDTPRVIADTGRLLTVAEIAGHLTVSRSLVRKLVAARKLAFVRIGRTLRFRPADLAAFEDQLRTDSLDAMLAHRSSYVRPQVS